MRAIGFRPVYPRTYRAYNVVVSVLLLAVSLPTMVVIALAMLATQGPGVLYRGDRIGRGHRPFKILKFRTLCSGRAANLTKDRTLPADADIFTPLGRFLRDTRLDELPQLVNVIRGDMNICGPRPVRAVIRNLHVSAIPGYDDRFQVRPGLLGPTQAYFGHGASKRLRAKMNSIAVRRPVDMIAELSFVVCVIGAMVSKLVASLVPGRLMSAFGVTRSRDIWLGGNQLAASVAVHWISSQELRIVGSGVVPGLYAIAIRMRSGGLRVAQVELWPGDEHDTYRFEAANDYGAYVIERYALGKAVLPPPVNVVQSRTMSSYTLTMPESGARA